MDMNGVFGGIECSCEPQDSNNVLACYRQTFTLG